MEIWDWSTSQKGVKGLARGGADMLICCWGGTGDSSVASATSLLAEAGEREGEGRKGGRREGGKDGEREGERGGGGGDGGMEGGKEGGREGGREGGKEGGREGGREHEYAFCVDLSLSTKLWSCALLTVQY